MAAAFATATDLATRLNRAVWTGGELAQVNQLLADASDLIRAEIGWQVYPAVSVTVTAAPDTYGHIRLPGSPIGAVSSVTVDGTALSTGDYEVHNGVVHVNVVGLVSVTYSVGYAVAPPDLVAWTCVVAAQMLSRAADGTLGATPSSEALADYRISYSERQQLGELPIPQRSLDRLRAAYGQAVHVA